MDWALYQFVLVVALSILSLVLLAAFSYKSKKQIQTTEMILKEAKGANGQLQLLENKIRICRKGFLAFMTQGLKGDKEIFLKHISSIQFKQASELTRGYIQFSFLGGLETKRGLYDAVQDENSIIFDISQQSEFQNIKQMIESRMLASQETPRQNMNDLEKLAELKQKGIITEEEFSLKKKQILGL